MAIKARLLDRVNDKVLSKLPKEVRGDLLGDIAREVDDAFDAIGGLTRSLIRNSK